uniref:Candidate secreted effector n=1 Tax=Meloidogyne incognita TaxID=6306 RepID=A0A914NBN3_MELIC
MCCDKNIICQDEDTRKGFCGGGGGGRVGGRGRRFSDYLIFRCGSLNNKKLSQKNKNETRGGRGGSISTTIASLFKG